VDRRASQTARAGLRGTGSSGTRCWLETRLIGSGHAGEVSRISIKAQNQIENADLLISPMVLLELEMLYDRGTIKYAAAQILADLTQQIGLSVCQMPFAQVVRAMANNYAPLVTKHFIV
jgi:hypothetical protein